MDFLTTSTVQRPSFPTSWFLDVFLRLPRLVTINKWNITVILPNRTTYGVILAIHKKAKKVDKGQ
jgi:hypothetical protein